MPSISSDSSSSRRSSHTLTDVDAASLRKVKSAPHFKVVASQAYVVPEVLEHHYEGSGTEDDPYVVEFMPHDPRDPMMFGQVKKWTITVLVAFATLAVSFVSSAYSGGIRQIMEEFGSGTEVTTLGIALFVLGVSFHLINLMWYYEDTKLRDNCVVCNRTSSMGASFRALRSPNPFLRDLWRNDSLQCRVSWKSKHRDTGDPSILCRRFRIFPAHQRRRRHCRYVSR